MFVKSVYVELIIFNYSKIDPFAALSLYPPNMFCYIRSKDAVS